MKANELLTAFDGCNTRNSLNTAPVWRIIANDSGEVVECKTAWNDLEEDTRAYTGFAGDVIDFRIDERGTLEINMRGAL